MFGPVRAGGGRGGGGGRRDTFVFVGGGRRSANREPGSYVYIMYTHCLPHMPFIYHIYKYIPDIHSAYIYIYINTPYIYHVLLYTVYCMLSLSLNLCLPLSFSLSDSVSVKDCQNQTHISRERARQLVQVRREHALNGNTVVFHS